MVTLLHVNKIIIGLEINCQNTEQPCPRQVYREGKKLKGITFKEKAQVGPDTQRYTKRNIKEK